ncbi:hypothetical protein Q4555_04210 [Octadecabacter sp. 1_MG-2023]|uniref:hypothetical protein n=1 Tax=unclassified Octadecabacter TaxID=196158 RepID=UPI001C09473D|nr:MULTISPECIES: hypothetical protein [unclassified Octadecabacter]MBU2992692.1 hypothetical protein [Octadecabacter sp. B2R22]MDO6733857.1 hypothetical protein [Octadecabacter sp. 1_MG-2023]
MTTDIDEKMLNEAFAQMRVADPVPSEDLMNRIMLDADMVLADDATAPQRSKPGFGAMLLDVIGGWPTFSGLAAATVAGVWIGAVQPAALTDFSTELWGDTIEVPLLESDLFAALEG